MATNISKKNIFCSAFATSVEYYDFIIYAYLTFAISAAFFPQGHHMVSLLETYGLFAIGYFMRPLGGIVFGHLGDRMGRRRVLIATVILMMLSLLAVVIVPTYAHWGIGATIVLLVSRMVQGFSIGGEYNGVLATLIENAPSHRRGLVTSLGTFISGNGVLLATIVVLLCHMHYSHQQMLDYAWRVPYGIGVGLSLVATVLIFMIDETSYFKRAQKSRKIVKLPLWEALKKHPSAVFLVFILAGYLGIAYYMAAGYIPDMLKDPDVFGFSEIAAMQATVIAAFFYAYSAPIWGWLSDQIGRKVVLICSIIGIGVFVYPAFVVLSTKAFIPTVLVYCVLMVLISACTATFVVAINEAFPTHLRYSGVGFGYNVGNALLGGSVLMASQLLFNMFGITGPAIYLIICSVIALLVVARMKETYKQPLVD